MVGLQSLSSRTIPTLMRTITSGGATMLQPRQTTVAVAAVAGVLIQTRHTTLAMTKGGKPPDQMTVVAGVAGGNRTFGSIREGGRCSKLPTVVGGSKD